MPLGYNMKFLLGELDKLISVSKTRIGDVAISCGTTAEDGSVASAPLPGMSVQLVGSPGEVVALSLLEPAPSTRVRAERFHVIRGLFWLRFTYVTPVLITKVRMETAGQVQTVQATVGHDGSASVECANRTCLACGPEAG
eukprot:COSAG01_NODE_4274_length_5190_cov_1.718916_4_plen_140_part_00